ncbi:MAG: CRISPR-associated endonuclease Cas1, partial [Deltaproteobacteria bacterium]|nr:CRISPR-associated endonuclease Cas1 [Deltaproteobacteria bacterium]
RPVLADRLAVTLINLTQRAEDDLETLPGGAVRLADQGRRTVLKRFQERKSEELQHRLLTQKLPLGLVPHMQARLLARHLRGDLADYPPFLYR